MNWGRWSLPTFVLLAHYAVTYAYLLGYYCRRLPHRFARGLLIRAVRFGNRLFLLCTLSLRAYTRPTASRQRHQIQNAKRRDSSGLFFLGRCVFFERNRAESARSVWASVAS